MTKRSVVILAGLFLIALLRRPETLTEPTFWNEDYRVFYAGGLLLEPYRGYLHVVPRLIGALEHLVPWPALMGNAIALAVTAGVGAFVASDRMASLIPDWRLRLAAGIFVVVQPAIGELLGSITYIQWWLGLLLLLLAYAVGRPGSIELATGALASATGPFAIFAAPLHWLRSERRTFAAVISVGVGAQLVTTLLAPRDVAPHIPSDLATIIARRLVLEPILGHGLTAVLPAATAIVIAPFSIRVLWALPKPLLGASAILLAASLMLSAETSAELADPGGAERYFFIPGYLVGLGAIVAIGRGDRMAWPVAAALAVGILFDLRLPPH